LTTGVAGYHIQFVDPDDQNVGWRAVSGIENLRAACVDLAIILARQMVEPAVQDEFGRN
jgi:hypothetical protein